MTSGCNTSFWKRANTHFERYYSWWARWNSWQNLLIHSDIYRHQLQTRRIHHHLALLFRSSLFQWFIFIIGVVFHRLENRIDQKLSQQHSYVNANGPIMADIWPIRWNHLWTSFFFPLSFQYHGDYECSSVLHALIQSIVSFLLTKRLRGSGRKGVSF